MSTVVSDIPIPSRIAHLLADPEVARWIHDFRTEQRGQAWDEGFDAGERDVLMHEGLHDWDVPCIPNPYRQEDVK